MSWRTRRRWSRHRNRYRKGKKSKKKTRARRRRCGGGVGESSRPPRTPSTTYRRRQGSKVASFRPPPRTYRAPPSGSRRFGSYRASGRSARPASSARPYQRSYRRTDMRWSRRPGQRKSKEEIEADELVDKLLKLGADYETKARTPEDKEKLTKKYARLLSEFGVTLELDPGPTTQYVKAVQRKLRSIAADTGSDEQRQLAAARRLAYIMQLIQEGGQRPLEGQKSPAELSTTINIYGDSTTGRDGARPLETQPLYFPGLYDKHDRMRVFDALTDMYAFPTQD